MADRRKLDRGETVLWGGEDDDSKQSAARQEMMNAIFEVSQTFSARKHELADKWLPSNISLKNNSSPPIVGLQSFKWTSDAMHKILVDFHYLLDDVITFGTIEEGRSAIRSRVTGKFTLPNGTIQDLNAQLSVHYIFKNKKVVEIDSVSDVEAYPEYNAKFNEAVTKIATGQAF